MPGSALELCALAPLREIFCKREKIYDTSESDDHNACPQNGVTARTIAVTSKIDRVLTSNVEPLDILQFGLSCGHAPFSAALFHPADC